MLAARHAAGQRQLRLLERSDTVFESPAGTKGVAAAIIAATGKSAFVLVCSTPNPAKLKAGYANFANAEPPLKLVLIENPGHGGSINHLGVQVESSDKVHAEIGRLAGEGMFTEEGIGFPVARVQHDDIRRWIRRRRGMSTFSSRW